MSAPLVFLDTETDGLGPNRRAWEVALIRRDDQSTRELHMWLPLDLRGADSQALAIGRFWDRHPEGRRVSGKPAIPGEMVVTRDLDAARKIMEWTFGAHLVGAIPSFDADVLARLLRANGLLPQWHHRLYCIESIVAGSFGRPVGGLRACAEAVGLTVEDGAEHTAMGDARMVWNIWDTVMGAER